MDEEAVQPAAEFGPNLLFKFLADIKFFTYTVYSFGITMKKFLYKKSKESFSNMLKNRNFHEKDIFYVCITLPL